MSSYFAQRQAIKAFGQASPVADKQVYKIPPVSEKKKQQNKEEKPQRDAQNKWFDDVAQKEKKGGYKCWECGTAINPFFIKAAIAHVLPKRDNQFPSVKTHPDNYLILGAGCGCHNRYDRTWEDAAQMKVWPLAVERFNKIYPFIAAKEKKNIPEELLQELEPNVLIASPIDGGVLIEGQINNDRTTHPLNRS